MQSEAEAWLDPLWESYKRLYITPEGRVLDRRQSRTTSEGQSYALLRAVWMDDQKTFDRVLAWTEENLARRDGLFAWMWRQGRVVDANTAADADQDIALALILAANQWKSEAYRQRAKRLVRAIRQEEFIQTPMGPIAAAGNWAVKERVANPSYFMPYAYELFARLDPQGPWREAIPAGYRLLRSLLLTPELKLPPDFIVIHADGRPERIPEKHGLSRDFSFDSIRVYWRLALDCQAFKRRDACRMVKQAWLLAAFLEKDGRLATAYSPQGEALTDQESLSFYGALLPAFALSFPRQAETILQDRLAPRALQALIEANDRYYDQNWVWFGLAAVSGRCPLD